MGEKELCKIKCDLVKEYIKNIKIDNDLKNFESYFVNSIEDLVKKLKSVFIVSILFKGINEKIVLIHNYIFEIKELWKKSFFDLTNKIFIFPFRVNNKDYYYKLSLNEYYFLLENYNDNKVFFILIFNNKEKENIICNVNQLFSINCYKDQTSLKKNNIYLKKIYSENKYKELNEEINEEINEDFILLKQENIELFIKLDKEINDSFENIIKKKNLILKDINELITENIKINNNNQKVVANVDKFLSIKDIESEFYKKFEFIFVDQLNTFIKSILDYELEKTIIINIIRNNISLFHHNDIIKKNFQPYLEIFVSKILKSFV